MFCYNDLLALGALRALTEAGLRVPEDVAVIGVDDIEEGQYSTPSLTTVAPDKGEIAKHAVQLLLNRLDGDQSAPAEVPADYDLVVREEYDGNLDVLSVETIGIHHRSSQRSRDAIPCLKRGCYAHRFAQFSTWSR